MSGDREVETPALPRPTSRRRLWAVLAARLAVSSVMLAILFGRIDFSTLSDRERDPWHLGIAVVGTAFMLASYLLASLRWRRTLQVLDHDVPWRALASSYLAGQFVGNFLPSTIGGDLLRIRRASIATGSTTIAFSSVVLERLTGFIVLPALILAGLALHPSYLEVRAGRVALILALGALVVLAAILTLAASRSIAGRFVHTSSWTRFIGAVHTGVVALRRHPERLLGVLASSAAYQMCVVAAVWCATAAVNLDVPPVALLVIAPAVSIVQLAPIGVGGLGVRETAFVIFLRPFGGDSAQAVAVGLIVYAMTLTASLAGAPAFALGSRHRQVRT